MAETKNLTQRILAVMGDVDFVGKDTDVEAGGGRSYKGVSHDAVIKALRGPMTKHGIVLRVEQTAEQAVHGQTKAGHPKIRYEGWYTVWLINADQPDDALSYPINAHAEDSGDKAPGKCISYAVKTVLLKAFALETGENDEHRHKPEEVAVIDDDSLLNLRALLQDTDTDEEAFVQALNGKLKLSMKKLAELPATHNDYAKNWLMAKAKKMQKEEVPGPGEVEG